MRALLGGGLALSALAVGALTLGWPGVALAITVIAFWLVLQFNQAVRVMKNAGNAPIGHVDSVVMLNAHLKAGMSMLNVVALTRSLGKKLPGDAEIYRWTDAGGLELTVNFDGGRCNSWQLHRPPPGGEPPPHQQK